MFGFGPQVPQVEAKDVLDAITQKKDILILDVRTEGEVEKGKIKGSLHIPLDQLQSKAEKILTDKEKNIYVYCLSGNRSAQAADILLKKGYKNVSSMKSGLLSWRSNNYPLEN